jgi:hypothetical protein
MVPTITIPSPQTLLDIKAGWTGFDVVPYRHSVKYFLKKINDNDPYRVFPLGVNYRIEVLWQVRAPKVARIYFEAMWKALFAYNSDIHPALNGYTECRKATQEHTNTILSFLKKEFVFPKPEEGYPKDWEVLYLVQLHRLNELPEIPERLVEVAKSFMNEKYKETIEDFLETRNTPLILT